MASHRLALPHASTVTLGRPCQPVRPPGQGMGGEIMGGGGMVEEGGSGGLVG